MGLSPEQIYLHLETIRRCWNWTKGLIGKVVRPSTPSEGAGPYGPYSLPRSTPSSRTGPGRGGRAAHWPTPSSIARVKWIKAAGADRRPRRWPYTATRDSTCAGIVLWQEAPRPGRAACMPRTLPMRCKCVGTAIVKGSAATISDAAKLPRS